MIVELGLAAEFDPAIPAGPSPRSYRSPLFVSLDVFFTSRRAQLVNLASRHALPATYPLPEFAEVGGLMSYGTNIADTFRHIGVYAGRILKGAKPADLPVVQSTNFELVINAWSARMLGLAVPPTLIATADEIIE